MDEGACWATVHRVAKSRTRLTDFTSLHFSCLILVSWLLPHSHLLPQNTEPSCHLSISWKRPFLSRFPTILIWTAMILQVCRNGLPFSSLDPFRSIILVVAGMFLLIKYKPDHDVLSASQFWALSVFCSWLNQYSDYPVSWPSHPQLLFLQLQVSYVFSHCFNFKVKISQ